MTESLLYPSLCLQQLGSFCNARRLSLDHKCPTQTEPYWLNVLLPHMRRRRAMGLLCYARHKGSTRAYPSQVLAEALVVNIYADLCKRDLICKKFAAWEGGYASSHLAGH